MLMSPALMKMGVPGTEKVGKNWVKMDIDVDGQEWVVSPTMVPRNGKKRYLEFKYLNVQFLINKM